LGLPHVQYIRSQRSGNLVPYRPNTACHELAIPRFNTCQKYSHQNLQRMSDMSDSTMGIGLTGGSVKRFLFTLL